MKIYRRLFVGEVINKNDLYVPYLWTKSKRYCPVSSRSIGKEILECNIKYYYREILCTSQNN